MQSVHHPAWFDFKEVMYPDVPSLILLFRTRSSVQRGALKSVPCAGSGVHCITHPSELHDSKQLEDSNDSDKLHQLGDLE